MSDFDRVPFGLFIDSNGKEEFFAVDEVISGRGCGCICPWCKIPLVARKGDVYNWHFAHKPRKSKNELDVTCEYSYHVSLVAMAKQLFSKNINIRLPEYMLGVYTDFGYYERKVVSESCVLIRDFEIESIFGNQFVDVITYVDNIPLLIYFGHKEKEVVISESDFLGYGDVVRIIKIDVSDFYLESKKARQELANLLFDSTEGKKWIYHPRQIEKIKALNDELEKMKNYKTGQHETKTRIVR